MASEEPTLDARPRASAGSVWFVAWAAVGIGATLAAVSLGPILLVPVAAIAATMTARPTVRRSAFGFVAGVGLVLLYIAYVQRDGPGTTCWQTATASGCEQHLDPIPWLTVGVACVAAGLVGHTRRFASRSRRYENAMDDDRDDGLTPASPRGARVTAWVWLPALAVIAIVVILVVRALS